MSLVAFPAQPADVPWPAATWPIDLLGPADEPNLLADELTADVDRFGTTYALLIVHRGRIVVERYGGALEHWDRPAEPVTTTTPLLSWSMAKSILHALVGTLVADGLLDPIAPAGVPAWRDDERAEITLGHLLAMRDGLAFVEDYDDAGRSDVIEMLFGAGADDVAGYAASKPLAHPPGEVFNYSSGTSNIVARLAGDAVRRSGAGGFEQYMHDRLFGPIGMRTADPRFDAAGTFIGSSYVYATARDFARFGLLALRGGTWDGRAVLPEGWVDHGRLPRSVDPDNGWGYGAHWWVTGEPHGGFWANGYEGQWTLCVPAADLVVVRLGRSERRCYPELAAWRAAVTDAFLPYS